MEYMSNFACEMKRIATISLSVVLSAIIIALGAGLAFVRCCHTQTMELAQLSDAGHHTRATADEKCCGHHANPNATGPQIGSPDCMKTVVIKLATTVTMEHQPITFSTLYFPLHSLADIAGRCSLPVIIKNDTRHHADSPHSPPRDYLRLIRILII